MGAKSEKRRIAALKARARDLRRVEKATVKQAKDFISHGDYPGAVGLLMRAFRTRGRADLYEDMAEAPRPEEVPT